MEKKFTAGRSWPTGKFEAWIRKRTIQPCFDCMQTGNRQFWDFQALAQIQCAKNAHDFLLLFHSVRGEGIVEIVKWDSYLEKMRIVLLESTVQDSETARTKNSFLCLNLHSYLQESKTAATEWKWQHSSTVPYVPRGKMAWTLGCTQWPFADQNLLFCEGLRMRAHHFSQNFQYQWCLVIKHVPHPEPITFKLCLI